VLQLSIFQQRHCNVSKKTLNNTYCTSSSTCRADLGLTCQANLCQCDATSKFWLTSSTQCVNLMSYSESGCTTDSHCISSQNLVCTLSKCFCSADYYWDSSIKKCVLRSGYFGSCSSNSDTCFKNLTCTDSKCICPSSQGYNSNLKQCISCKSGWSGYDDRCYKISSSTATWATANSTCVSDSSWLHVPSSQREMDEIQNIFNNDIWIGLFTLISTPNCDNTWYIVTNQDTLQMNWSSSQPNCVSGNQFCVKQNQYTFFNDYDCLVSYKYACEYAP